MIANYHTHTERCHHAFGADRDYVEAAVAAGFSVLGFSDHAPHPFLRADRETWRFCPSEIPGYFASLLALREEYRDRIQILIGFETEYYPDYFEAFLDSIDPYPCDYLIMGQHFLKNEIEPDAPYMGDISKTPALLTAYVDQAIEGLKTGRFTYLAHPDYPKMDGNDAFYEAEMHRLCTACVAMDLPIEINCAGLRDGVRHYPSLRFLRIAAEAGCKAVIGADAHHPEDLSDPAVFEGCRRLAAEAGIAILDTVPLRDPFHGRTRGPAAVINR